MRNVPWPPTQRCAGEARGRRDTTAAAAGRMSQGCRSNSHPIAAVAAAASAAAAPADAAAANAWAANAVANAAAAAVTAHAGASAETEKDAVPAAAIPVATVAARRDGIAAKLAAPATCAVQSAVQIAGRTRGH